MEKKKPPLLRSFRLGKLLMTPGAIEAMNKTQNSPLEVLARHAGCDWGDVDAEDWKANDYAIDGGDRLFSAYHLKDDTKIWVITEADRSVTTILLPSEY